MAGDGGEDVFEKKKSHRDRNAGRKANKKKAKKDAEGQQTQELTAKQRNPKAFAFNSAVRAERRFRRKQDIETKKQHIPVVDRTPLEPPPIVIAIVGPPKVGKSTLINSLLKLFVKSPITNIKGPVTIVTGKKRRITLIECNNDITSMIDLAKIADLVLLMFDASFGFEMEVFEFLNICQVHGMPKIMGVLTHLDMIKNSKTLKNTKKILKHRFWAEICQGAKLFYLSGILHDEYLRNEIKNLGRFISVMKFRPLTWRSTHSYILGDRYEDLTNLEEIRKNPKCDRNISLYGYVRGIPLNKDSYVHIAGLGDLKMADVTYLPDPCPLPEQIKKRALIDKEKFIYAPFSGVGGIVYDKDAVYVELGGSHSHKKRENTETDNLFTNLTENKLAMDEKIEQSELQLFSGGPKLTQKDFESNESHGNNNEKKKDDDFGEDSELSDEEDDFSDDNSEDGDGSEEESDDESEKEDDDGELLKDNDGERGKIMIKEKIKKSLGKSNDESGIDDDLDSGDDFDSDDDLNDDQDSSGEDGSDLNGNEYDSNGSNSDEDTNLKWKDNLVQKAKDAFIERQSNSENLMKLVYGIFESKYLREMALREKEEEEGEGNEMEDDEEDMLGGLFKKASKKEEDKRMEKDNMNKMESSLFVGWNEEVRNWLEEDNKELIKDCFVTGKWKDSEDASELLRLDDAEDLSDADSEVFGDFEDLETGEKHTAKPSQQENQGEKRKRDESEKDIEADREKLAEKKRKLKEKFDSEYDNVEKSTFYDDLKSSAEKQAELNKKVFEDIPDDLRVQIEGFRPGMYVRMEFENVPSEFITNFDASYPLLIGALNMGEENVGYVNVKIKKHRWYKKILKTNDPLIISLGWRRFQTIPVYSKLEDDLKFRFLKYTPEFLTCNAHFWGPITPQGTGFLALQRIDNSSEVLKQGFRIAATGAVQELDKSTQIMKKLKLIGTPLKIYKKTAFIKGMFNTSLEVAKFEGARIQTVSGIRGQIKKAMSKPEGSFRATFEDKIMLSDIVFCRTWVKVPVKPFYNVVTTLLLPPEQKNSWKGVRTAGEIKRAKGIKYEPNLDSLYTPIEREDKVFKPLVIPRKLQKALPYKDKPKFGPNDKKKKMDRVAVVKEPHEKKVSDLIKMLTASYNRKQEKEKQQTKERLAEHRRMLEEVESRKYKKVMKQKKEKFRHQSKRQKND